MKHEAINVETAKTSELVAFYNKHAEEFGKKHVTKFADRQTAELRVTQMLADIAALQSDKDEKDRDKGCDHKLSEAVAASWQDPMVREARAKRYHVLADGVRFNSVEAAFRALNLPMNRAARFRAKLRDEGHGEINNVKFELAE